jgi:hypothetical protein
MSNARPTRDEKASPSSRNRESRGARTGALYQVTFCTSCGEAIPAKAHTCYRCGAKQERAEDPIRVVFCESCGKDYPAKAMACFHCGHLNPQHPMIKNGRTAR